ncbi:efflux RND transporter periplasmic adaptor subunit [Polaribacter sp. Hel1_85]|uniref:efflux RND transporter periplasmic adaptor subunit n=1 Tax=Polaribacter sp. Hel1_85 TaxID=1250005 RepID=UPI00052D0952|nr:efflux RND transporter periplasmic adaptor subunit [Polaribacter sp. Hel1_85]KGL63399.1 macrolide-specific efflux protein MacA [Polaribacter sp. Hel1_85]
MKKIKWIIPLILAIGILVYFIVLKPKVAAKNIEFTYTSIEKGNIESVVSSTGTLEAINTVEIGTQISGTIKRIYVDYNEKVKAGQLLAEMDLKLLKTSLISAQANLAVSKAQLNQAKEEYERSKILFEKGVIAQQEFSNVKYTYEQARGATKAASANVNNIQVNMQFAHITSPISGTITERSVEEGQTVAASFATPKLFIIAEDLSKMQILADVDESDIGYVKSKMNVRFSVQTYPEKEFMGFVSQIRLQPIEVNNVVNYQVVVDVDNSDRLLLPGMTANLEFITQKASNVFLINNSALRFRPNEYMLKTIKPVLEEKAKNNLPDSIYKKFTIAINNEETYVPARFKKSLPPKIGGFFYKNDDGNIDFEFIEIGIKTGLQSEIKHLLSDDIELNKNIKAIYGIKSK